MDIAEVGRAYVQIQSRRDPVHGGHRLPVHGARPHAAQHNGRDVEVKVPCTYVVHILGGSSSWYDEIIITR